MADAKEAAPGAAAPAAPRPPSGPKLPIILALVNLLAILGATGMLVYTRILFKRPVITESSERERLANIKATAAPITKPGLVKFEPILANIESNVPPPNTTESGPVPYIARFHHAQVGFTLEVRDEKLVDQVEAIRPQIVDRLLRLLGHKKYHEITTVQGRYVLRTEILDAVNQMILHPEAADQESPAAAVDDNVDAIVTNVYFTQFIVQ